MSKLSNIWSGLRSLVADIRAAFQTNASGHSAMDAQTNMVQDGEIELSPGVYILPPPATPPLTAEEYKRYKAASVGYKAVNADFVDIPPVKPTLH